VSHGANLVFLILIQTRIGISLFLTGNAGKKTPFRRMADTPPNVYRRLTTTTPEKNT